MAKPGVNFSHHLGTALFFDNVIELLSDSRKWCRETMARDKYGNPIVPGDLRARQWCVTGAIIATYRSTVNIGEERSIPDLTAILRRALKTKLTLNAWNDQASLSHADMLAKLTQANNLIRSGQVRFFSDGA